MSERSSKSKVREPIQVYLTAEERTELDRLAEYELHSALNSGARAPCRPRSPSPLASRWWYAETVELRSCPTWVTVTSREYLAWACEPPGGTCIGKY